MRKFNINYTLFLYTALAISFVIVYYFGIEIYLFDIWLGRLLGIFLLIFTLIIIVCYNIRSLK